jgi:hypothetical protein
MVPEKFLSFFSKKYNILLHHSKIFFSFVYHKVATWIEAILLNQVFYFWRGSYQFINGLPYRIPVQMEASKG